MAAVTHELQRGRTLVLDDDLVEVRAPSGTVEVRLRITDDGPVLELASVRLSLRAAAVDVDCEEFTVSAGGDVRLDAGGDVRVSGDTIHLN